MKISSGLTKHLSSCADCDRLNPVIKYSSVQNLIVENINSMTYQSLAGRGYSEIRYRRKLVENTISFLGKDCFESQDRFIQLISFDDSRKDDPTALDRSYLYIKEFVHQRKGLYDPLSIRGRLVLAEMQIRRGN